MKLKLLVAMLCICSFPAFSQISKGQWLVGGGLDFTSHTDERFNWATYSEKEFSIPINAGYFVADNLAIGLRAKYSNYTQDISYVSAFFRDYSFSGTSIGGGPFIRGYLVPGTSAFNLLLEGSYLYGYMETTSQYKGLSPSSDSRKTSEFMIAGGPVYFINPNIALEGIIGYRSQTVIDSEDKASTFFIGIGFQVHLGKAKEDAPKFKR